MTSKILIGLLVTGVLVGPLGPAQAQQPNLSDIASCNEQAQAKAGSPSTSPPAHPGPAHPGPPTANAPTLTPKPGTQTDSSGSIVVQSPDPLLQGMATDGLTDPAYRTAYRACMAGRVRRP
jgi:hypothetical protein